VATHVYSFTPTYQSIHITSAFDEQIELIAPYRYVAF